MSALPSLASGLELAVRPAEASDVPGLHALGTQIFLDTYATEGVRPALAQEAEDQFSTAAFLALLERPQTPVFVAERNGHLVAFAQLILGTAHALVGEVPSAELYRLYVQAPFQRRGVGRLLLDHAEALARARGLHTLWLTAWVGNTRARAFYRTQGYRELGSTTYGFGGDAFENRLYAKALNAPAHGAPEPDAAAGDRDEESLRISTADSELDVALVHRFLSEQSSWARAIPLETVQRGIAHSLCFGGYRGAAQVAFARVITDHATFANLVDVFVLPVHRGNGYGEAILEAVMSHPSLQGLRRFTLATANAHGLYARFGFAAPVKPEALMERHVPDIYTVTNPG